MKYFSDFIFSVRLLMLAALSAAVSVSVCADEKPQESQGTIDDLPTLQEMKDSLPDAQALMKSVDDPYDWIVLRGNRVLVTEPVYPRPDTLQKMATERSELENARGGTAEQRAARSQRKLELQNLKVILLEDRSQDYELPVTEVEQVIHFEELLLMRASQLMEAGETPTAYDLLNQVEKNFPGWPKAKPYFDALLLREAELKVQSGDSYGALALFDELASQNPEYPRLSEAMGKLVDQMITESVAEKNFQKARYLIGRLAKPYSGHAVVQKWQNQLQGQSASLLAQAQQKSAAGIHTEAARLADQANTIWRLTGNDRQAYNQAMSRHQVIKVAVRDFAGGQTVSPIALAPERRHHELTTIQLFEPVAADELTYFQSPFFELWDPRDLGREVLFTLRQTRAYWQTQPVITANQVADALSDQLNPDLASFNPRLASFVKSFSVKSPTQLQVTFTRVPLNLEALFRFPVMTIPEGNTQARHEAPRELLSKRFVLASEDETERSYVRSLPEPDGLIPTQYHVAEIVERKFPDRHTQLQAFNRGEVDVLPQLLPWEIDVFVAAGRATVQRYALPRSHVLVFNPLSPNVENPQIRRALSFGVDRENLLKKVILRDPDMKHGRISKAPWYSGSYANNPLVDPPRYDMYLSYLLRLAALEKLRIPEKQKFVAAAKAKALEGKQEWDEIIFRRDHADEITASASHIELPVLKMLVDPDEGAMLAAEQMAIRWNALGFRIELIPANTEGEPLTGSGWDFMYRRVTLLEPLLDLWSLMLTDDSFDVTRLASYPDWMRQELINLDYASSFLDAQQRLFLIHRHLAAQGFIVPLWELDEYMALQRTVKGFESRPLSLYHGAEKWVLTP
ncbi:MAG: ABC transporter substrate-binding protein [Planctomycetaceae bacterium]